MCKVVNETVSDNKCTSVVYLKVTLAQCPLIVICNNQNFHVPEIILSKNQLLFTIIYATIEGLEINISSGYKAVFQKGNTE